MTEDETCPKCRSQDISISGFDKQQVNYQCRQCRHKWVDQRELPDGLASSANAITCKDCSVQIKDFFPTTCSLSGKSDDEAMFFVCPHCHRVYYKEGDFVARFLFKRKPQIYSVGEAVDSGKNHLLVRNYRMYVVYRISGPITFRTNLVSYDSPPEPLEFGFVDLDVDKLKKKKASLVELLQSYLRNDIKGELFLDMRAFLPARDMLLVVKALKTLKAGLENKDHIAKAMLARLQSVTKPTVPAPEWFLEEIFFALKVQEELGCSSLVDLDDTANQLIKLILRSKTTARGTMWGTFFDDVGYDPLEKTLYAVSSLKLLGYTLSEEDILKMRKQLRDEWHFPRHLMRSCIGVALLHQLGDPPIDNAMSTEWLTPSPENAQIRSTYCKLTILEKLGIRPNLSGAWKDWLVNYLSRPYWEIDPENIALAVLSLEIIEPSSFSGINC